MKRKNNNMKVQLADALADALSAVLDDKTKSVTNPADGLSLFGSGGFLATEGLEPEVINAAVAPEGLFGELTSEANNTESPLFTAVVGLEESADSPATNTCDDNPSGFLTGATLTAQFGRLAFDTKTMEESKIITKVNRGVYSDLLFYGNLLGLTDFDPSALDPADVMNIVTSGEMLKVGMLMMNGTSSSMGLVRQVWQGNPSSNTVGGGYKEMPGLDIQIATGQKDVLSGTLAPALDSFVEDFGYANVDGSGAKNVVRYLAAMETSLRHRAIRAGVLPVSWAIVMRNELWQELTASYPTEYNTDRLAAGASGNTRLMLDGSRLINQRDEMRQSKTITINGRNYPVITDDGIFEHNSTNNANVVAGEFASSIYMVPMKVAGGLSGIKLENVDYRASSKELAMLTGQTIFWTDRGLYSWAAETQKWCFKLSAKTERRVVLRTPQLAGRIDHVLYAPLKHLADPTPGSPYNYEGGVSGQSVTSLNTLW